MRDERCLQPTLRVFREVGTNTLSHGVFRFPGVDHHRHHNLP